MVANDLILSSPSSTRPLSLGINSGMRGTMSLAWTHLDVRMVQSAVAAAVRTEVALFPGCQVACGRINSEKKQKQKFTGLFLIPRGKIQFVVSKKCFDANYLLTFVPAALASLQQT